jgi:hypothetical protein
MVMLFFIFTFQNKFIKPLINKCPETNATFPFWSRGFARTCCDVYPTSFGKHKGGFFEAGGLSDPTYFLKKSCKSGDILYVAIADFPVFLDTFHRFDKTMRITLVTGADDIGAPWEIFHPNRNFYDYKMSALWPNGQVMTMRQFLGDTRLVRWYTQNYDLVGNTSFTQSDINELKDKEIIAKVFPLPIGLDFHTLAEKNRNLSPQQALDSVCDQNKDLSVVLSTALPFSQRRSHIYAKFDCELRKHHLMRVINRGEICNLLKIHHQNSSGNKTDHIIFADSKTNKKERNLSSRESKLLFWKQVVKVQFAVAPAGMGTDTHRVWEILHLRCIPIVISSPLDRLYKMFPVIIVKKWSEIFDRGAVSKFQAEIKENFGADPFTDSVLEKLGVNYWMKEIRNSASVIPRKPLSRNSSSDSLSPLTLTLTLPDLTSPQLS